MDENLTQGNEHNVNSYTLIRLGCPVSTGTSSLSTESYPMRSVMSRVEYDDSRLV